MKKYKILLYVLLGICLSFYLQNILLNNSFASDFDKNKSYNIEENNRPNFIKASEHAIQAVVHIKSKFISKKGPHIYLWNYGR